jgi:tetratricopeptide (TPR) repeat protein
MRLSPIHSAWYLPVVAHAYRPMLRYDEAMAVYKQAIALAPNQIAAHLGPDDLLRPGRSAGARACAENRSHLSGAWLLSMRSTLAAMSGSRRTL